MPHSSNIKLGTIVSDDYIFIIYLLALYEFTNNWRTKVFWQFFEELNTANRNAVQPVEYSINWLDGFAIAEWLTPNVRFFIRLLE